MRRWLLLGAIYLALALGLTAPLLRHLGSAFPHDIGDPLLNTWLLWWNTQHLPLTAAWWNAAMFHPAPDVMALSEVLIGLVPMTAPIQWLTGSPLVAYNLAFILTFPLCGLSAAMLAYAVTRRRDAAALAGLAFAFAPYGTAQMSHLQMLAYYGAPLSLAALHRYDQSARRGWLALFAAAWLLQALSNGYALFHLSVLVVLWIVWFVRSRRALIEVSVAWGLAMLPLIPLLATYQQVHRHWHLIRDINEMRRYSVDVADFLSAPPELVVWGSRLWTARPETAVFPGLTVMLVLSMWAWLEWRGVKSGSPGRPALDERLLIGLSMIAALVALSTITLGSWHIGPLSVSDFHKPFSIAVYARALAWIRSHSIRSAWRERSTAMFYVIALVAMYGLALGPEPRLLGRPLLYEPPYAWLMRLPGFASLRVPGRFAMLGVLCQSTLLALAVARFPRGRWPRLVPAGLALGLLVDGWAVVPVAPAPGVGPTVDARAAAVVELPLGESQVDFTALYHQMTHARPLVNGYSGYDPPHYLPLTGAVAGRLDALAEIDRQGEIEVAIDRSRGDSLALAAAVAMIPGVDVLPSEAHWQRFLVPQRRQPLAPVGAPLPMTSVTANTHGEDATRMRDEQLESGWHGGIDQVGNEEIQIDLGTPQVVGAIVLDMGAVAFGYPRLLAVDAQQDNGEFAELFRGPTAALTVRAALDQSERVPLSIVVPPTRTRRLRLRQLGTAAGTPWWIAELSVHAPAATQ